MSIQKNYATARLAFENAKATVQNLGYTIDEAKCTQSFLRCDVPLAANVSQFQVPILSNLQSSATPYATNKFLDLQDTFVVSEFGFLVGVGTGAAASDFIPSTYEGIFGANAATARSLWNGRMKVIMDNQEVVPAYDLGRHYKVPQQQTAANADYTTSGINYQNSTDLNSDGFESISPMWVFSGSSNLRINIDLPQSLSAVTSNSRLVFIFRGILMQNTTSVK